MPPTHNPLPLFHRGQLITNGPILVNLVTSCDVLTSLPSIVHISRCFHTCQYLVSKQQRRHCKLVFVHRLFSVVRPGATAEGVFGEVHRCFAVILFGSMHYSLPPDIPHSTLPVWSFMASGSASTALEWSSTAPNWSSRCKMARL